MPSSGRSDTFIGNLPSIVLVRVLYVPHFLEHTDHCDHSENLHSWTSHVTEHACVTSGI